MYVIRRLLGFRTCHKDCDNNKYVFRLNSCAKNWARLAESQSQSIPFEESVLPTAL